MKKLALIITGIILVFSTAAICQETVDEYIDQMDQLYKKWDYNGTLELALKAYSAFPDDYGVTWRLSRAFTDVAFRLNDKEKTEEMYKKAMEYGEKATTLNPDDAEGHFRWAVAHGRLALFKGGKEKIRLSKKMKEELDIALKFNPEHALAYYALGRWNYGISDLSRFLKFFAKIIYGGVPQASFEQAAKNYELCLKYKPEYVEGWMEAGRVYKKLKEWQKANDALEKCLSLPNSEKDDPIYKKEAKELLKVVKKKLN